MANRIYIVGMGPGREEMMTGEALNVLDQSDVIVGYTLYLQLLGGRFRGERNVIHSDASGGGTVQAVF